MKKTILLLLFLVSPSSFGAIALTNAIYCNSGCGNGSSTITKAYPSNVTAGSNLVAWTVNSNNTSTTDSVSDSRNGTWTKASCSINATNVTQLHEMWYFPNAAAGATTVTATLTSNGNGRIWIGEVTGGDTGTVVDVCPTPNATFGGSHITLSSVTTTRNGDLLLAFLYSSNSSAAVGSNFSWTTTGVFADGTTFIGQQATQATAGSTVFDANISSGNWVLIGMALKAAGAASVPTMPPSVYEEALAARERFPASVPVVEGNIWAVIRRREVC